MTPQTYRIVTEALDVLESVYGAWLKALQTSDTERQLASGGSRSPMRVPSSCPRRAAQRRRQPPSDAALQDDLLCAAGTAAQARFDRLSATVGYEEATRLWLAAACRTVNAGAEAQDAAVDAAGRRIVDLLGGGEH